MMLGRQFPPGALNYGPWRKFSITDAHERKPRASSSSGLSSRILSLSSPGVGDLFRLRSLGLSLHGVGGLRLANPFFLCRQRSKLGVAPERREESGSDAFEVLNRSKWFVMLTLTRCVSFPSLSTLAPPKVGASCGNKPLASTQTWVP